MNLKGCSEYHEHIRMSSRYVLQAPEAIPIPPVANEMLKSFIAVLSIWSSAILAAPPWLGLQFEKRAGELPTLTLPYATYRAARYNPNGDVG